MNFIAHKFLEFYREKPVLTTTNMLFSMSFPIDDILIPYLTGKIVNRVHERLDWKTPLVYLILVLLFMQVFYTLTYWHDARLFPHMQNFIRHGMLKDYLEHFSSNFHEVNLGEVMSRFVKIPLVTTMLFERFKNYILPYSISFIVTAYFISRYDKFLAIVLVIIVICVLAIIVMSPKLCKDATKSLDTSLAIVDEETEDIIRNRSVIYTTDQIPDELIRMKRYEDGYTNAFANTMDCVVNTRFIAIILLAVMLFVAYQRSVTGIKSGALKVGSFVTVLTIITQWFGSLGWLSSNIRDVVIEWGMLRAYEDLKNDMALNRNNVHQEVSNIAKDGIVLKNVNYMVKTRTVPILKNLNIVIEKGERVAIIGDIGSGKSTLLQILSGLVRASEGGIYIDGVEMNTMSKRTLKKKIVYVPQNPILFNRSAVENMTYGLKGISKNNVEMLLHKLGLQDAFSDLNNGIYSNVGKNGSHLSGGQRQIIQCIRAMLTNPDIIILDEITASIDPVTKKKLFRLLDALFKDKTVIMVTHDEELMKFSTRIIQLYPVKKDDL